MMTETEPELSYTDAIAPGDRLQVEIESSANPFGSTQQATMDVERIEDGVVFGVDPTWGDETEILGGLRPHYADAGKSGDVTEIRQMDTTEDGVTIHGTGSVLYRHSEGGQ